MATGMFGGGAFVWILLLGFRAALRLIGQSSEYAWIGFLFLQMTVYGCFSGSLWSLSGFWYMLAAVLVMGMVRVWQHLRSLSRGMVRILRRCTAFGNK